MGQFKEQAKRLRERLKSSGIEIPVALSLETIAAIHQKPHWDALAPMDKALVSSVQVTQRAIDEIPFDFRSTPGIQVGPLTEKPVHIIVLGSIGTGKTTTAMLLADHFSGRGSKPIVPVLLHTPDHNTLEHNTAEAIRRLSELRASPAGVIVVDDLELAENQSRREILTLLHDASVAGHSLIITTNDSRTLMGWMREVRGGKRLRWPIFRGLCFFIAVQDEFPKTPEALIRDIGLPPVRIKVRSKLARKGKGVHRTGADGTSL